MKNSNHPFQNVIHGDNTSPLITVEELRMAHFKKTLYLIRYLGKHVPLGIVTYK